MADTATISQTARLLFLHAQTPLHTGIGTALGSIDRSILRERHTQWPTIPGAALRGILHDHCREITEATHVDESHLFKTNVKDLRALTRDRPEVAIRDDASLVTAFGPSKGIGACDHSGTLAVTDTRLAAFAVRSSRGILAWVTCPAVLTRLGRDLKLVVAEETLDVPQSLGDDDLLCAADSPLHGGESSVVLEGFEYKVRGTCEAVANWLAANAMGDKLTAQCLKSHLAVIDDVAFTHHARYATEIVARVHIDHATQTATDGAICYQEVLPAESLLYSLVLADPNRNPANWGETKNAAELLDYLRNQLCTNSVLRFGAHAALGYGRIFAHLTEGRGK